MIDMIVYGPNPDLCNGFSALYQSKTPKNGFTAVAQSVILWLFETRRIIDVHGDLFKCMM